ncbi:putative 3-methyladenine DNA glycosylase [Frankia canadensis]|uniref:Putative 3-methyladenine DNA glycosylase n=1 Tax=Frankia canadensis TaxID=1836972 RepID=A0A2I2KZ62_9ACTN|nr:DNA-3-methyladenine glycosylase [Frankia canadensis]SNQ50948.1 putative 3-methyladenine DNA glycosylase [Frankia canadensis]SOU58238.1 putative 3-methyladenine DNA glycosylase [Frankia canadensis]
MGCGLNAPAPYPAEFYDRPVLAVAPELLGATVWHGPVAVRITEVEAYGGLDDPASHAFRGATPRAAVMFGPPGRAYVYLSYGVHWCLNIVCGPVDQAAAVLVRSGEVTTGIAAVRARWPHLADRDLARGPGRLGRVLGVGGELTGTAVTGGGALDVAGPSPVSEPRSAIRRGPRVGINAAADRPWRFWLDGEPTVSGPGRRRRPPG